MFLRIFNSLTLLIKGGIYVDISVEELNNEYANEHSKLFVLENSGHVTTEENSKKSLMILKAFIGIY